MSHNPRAVALYSGSIGAFLQTSTHQLDQQQNAQALSVAAAWLEETNHLMQEYASTLVLDSTPRFPTMQVADPVQLSPDIVVDGEAFDCETHNEDHAFDRLPQAAIVTDQTQWTSKGDPDLEAVLFSSSVSMVGWPLYIQPDSQFTTALKDAQHKLYWIVPHFSDNHYWPAWMYLKVEELRIFQNTNRLITAQRKSEHAGRLCSIPAVLVGI